MTKLLEKIKKITEFKLCDIKEDYKLSQLGIISSTFIGGYFFVHDVIYLSLFLLLILNSYDSNC